MSEKDESATQRDLRILTEIHDAAIAAAREAGIAEGRRLAFRESLSLVREIKYATGYCGPCDLGYDGDCTCTAGAWLEAQLEQRAAQPEPAKGADDDPN